MRETLAKNEEFKDSPLGRIPKDWEVVNLGSVLTVLYRYPTYYGIQYVETGVPEVRGELILDDGYLDNRVALYRYISESTASRFHKVRLEPGDFVLSVRGTMGKVAMVATELKGAVITANLIRLQFNQSLVSPQWARHFLLSNIFQDQLDLETSATTIKTIQAPALSSMLLRLPSFQEQEHIAEILNTVDEAIAHTSSLIAKLKQMKAGLLHDLLTRGLDENGELRDATAHPEQFKDSPLGQIPQEWKFCKFGDQVTLQRGFDITSKEMRHGNVPVIASSGLVGYHDTPMANPPGVITGRKGSLGEAFYIEEPYYPTDTTLWVRDFHGNYPKFVRRFIQWMRLERLDSATACPTLNRNFVHPIPVAFPLVNEQIRIEKVLDIYDNRIRTEEDYRDKLKLQKQGLMHDLLTGKVRVKDA